jgi:hypothetical protein
VPVIGVPFYLADERLAQLQDEAMEGIEGATEEEILKYLRHETGHAFNYAYRLHETAEWRDTFGPYSRPYQEDYTPDPFSRNFVRHIAGWYAQKHPDEDFAETFAVWLTPAAAGSDWREAYKDWGAYKKLLYVDKVVRRLGRAEPKVGSGEVHLPADELRCSVDEFTEMFRPASVEVQPYFDADLKDIFARRPAAKGPGDEGQPEGKEAEWVRAGSFLVKHRRSLVNKIAYWTGLNDAVIRGLINHFAERCRTLDLWVSQARATDTAIEVAAYATTLCLNKLFRGDFIIK